MPGALIGKKITRTVVGPIVYKRWVWSKKPSRLAVSNVFNEPLKLRLHERLLAYLSPDTVTGDDGRHPNRCRGGCRLKWNMSQFLLRNDTVIYEAATQRPVDELRLTFYIANRHWSSSSSCMHYYYAFVISIAWLVWSHNMVIWK